MTKTQYDKLKEDGTLFKKYPKATGDFEKDVDYVFLVDMGRNPS
ncbi:MAG: hypothetical protein VW683_10290 [Betaproteobacteria bacterium]|jgi:hypothetical protein